MRSTLASANPYLPERAELVREQWHQGSPPGSEVRRWVTANAVEFLSFTNAHQRCVDGLGPVRGFHLIRDPRDIVVSTYYSDLLSHPLTADWPQLTDIRNQLQQMNKDDGLLWEIEHLWGVFNALETWDYTQPNVLEVRLESLMANPAPEFVKIFVFLGLVDKNGRKGRHPLVSAMKRRTRMGTDRIFHFSPSLLSEKTLSVERLLAIVSAHAFTPLSGGRSPGEEDPASHYRKGVKGDWKNHFNRDHVARFKSLYNGLLLQLGYEETPDW